MPFEEEAEEGENVRLPILENNYKEQQQYKSRENYPIVVEEL